MRYSPKVDTGQYRNYFGCFGLCFDRNIIGFGFVQIVFGHTFCIKKYFKGFRTFSQFWTSSRLVSVCFNRFRLTLFLTKFGQNASISVVLFLFTVGRDDDGS